MSEPAPSRTDALAAVGVVVLIVSLIISSLTVIANTMVIAGVRCLTPWERAR
jgi:hypothetical protein